MPGFCSIFNQLLQLFPRTEFEQAVHATRAARFGRSLSKLVALVRMNLFVYRDLWDWRTSRLPRPRYRPSPQQPLGFG